MPQTSAHERGRDSVLQNDEATSGNAMAIEENEAFAADDLEEGDQYLDSQADEDEDMALNLAGGTNGMTGMPDLQMVQMRLASGKRALADWKVHGQKTGKSRNEVYDQLLDDICNYYGYNRFLAEKLADLFPVEEVSCMPNNTEILLNELLLSRQLRFLMHLIRHDLSQFVPTLLRRGGGNLHRR